MKKLILIAIAAASLVGTADAQRSRRAAPPAPATLNAIAEQVSEQSLRATV